MVIDDEFKRAIFSVWQAIGYDLLSCNEELSNEEALETCLENCYFDTYCTLPESAKSRIKEEIESGRDTIPDFLRYVGKHIKLL